MKSKVQVKNCSKESKKQKDYIRIGSVILSRNTPMLLQRLGVKNQQKNKITWKVLQVQHTKYYKF